MSDEDRAVPEGQARPMAFTPAPPPLGHGWVFYLLIMVGIALLPILGTDFMRQRILRTGVPARARVTKIVPTGDYHNDQPEVVISLEVTPEGGAPFESKVETYMSPVYLPRFQPGAVVDVRFDPKAPKDVALVGP